MDLIKILIIDDFKILTIMIHIVILKIIHLGWLGVPFPLYALYSHHFLDLKQAQLLVVQSILQICLMFPGWLMLFMKLVGNGCFVLVALDLSIAQYQQFISRYEIEPYNNPYSRKTKKYRQINGSRIFMIDSHKTLKKFKIKQTFIFPLLIAIWLCIRIKFTKVVQYGKGYTLFDGRQFQGFLSTLDGWNCNYPQFSIIPLIWLAFIIFSWYILDQTIKIARQDKSVDSEQFQDINGYKIYLLNYLIIPATCVLIIDIVYNITAHLLSDGLLQCYAYFKFGILIMLIVDWGIPVIIGIYFFKKIGRFSLLSDPSQISVNENNEEMLQAHLVQNLSK